MLMGALTLPLLQLTGAEYLEEIFEEPGMDLMGGDPHDWGGHSWPPPQEEVFYEELLPEDFTLQYGRLQAQESEVVVPYTPALHPNTHFERRQGKSNSPENLVQPSVQFEHQQQSQNFHLDQQALKNPHFGVEPQDLYTPQDPYSKPLYKQVQPHDPFMKPQDLPLQPEDPFMQPTDPHIQPTDPYVRLHDPYTESNNPPMQPLDPYPKLQDPYMEPEDPRMKLPDPYKPPLVVHKNEQKPHQPPRTLETQFVDNKKSDQWFFDDLGQTIHVKSADLVNTVRTNTLDTVNNVNRRVDSIINRYSNQMQKLVQYKEDLYHNNIQPYLPYF